MARSIKIAAGGSLAVVIAIAGPCIQKFEGMRNDPYWDVGHILTVCYGETADIKARRYTDAECRTMFDASLKAHASRVLACLPAAAPAPTLAAFVSFGYNEGTTAACGSLAAAKLRAGDITGACNGLLAWNKVRSPLTHQLVISRGLSNRREAERTICLEGLPR